VRSIRTPLIEASFHDTWFLPAILITSFTIHGMLTAITAFFQLLTSDGQGPALGAEPLAEIH
jgi:hypothetical protein